MNPDYADRIMKAVKGVTPYDLGMPGSGGSLFERLQRIEDALTQLTQSTPLRVEEALNELAEAARLQRGERTSPQPAEAHARKGSRRKQ